MTNEEKAIEIADRHTYIADDIEYSDVESAALEMAEWKDKQFKEFLEKVCKEQEALLREGKNLAIASFHYDGIIFLKEVINKFLRRTDNEN